MIGKATGLVMAKTVLMLACILVLVAALSATAGAQQVIFDDFNRDDGGLGTTPIGGETWLATGYAILGNAATSGTNHSAYVAFSAPTDAEFSVAGVTQRGLGGTGNHSTAIGFSDHASDPHVGGSTTGASSLNLMVDIDGVLRLLDNNFSDYPGIVFDKTLADVGLSGSYTGDLPMLLELDPINNTARAVVNNVEVYNIPYTIAEPITFVGFFNSSTGTGHWDDFSVDTGPGTPVFSRTWRSDKSGDWNGAGNWTPSGIPEDNNQTAVFGDAISEPQVVFTKADKTINAIQFVNAHTYAVAGTGTITLAAGTAPTAIDVFLGDHQFQAAVKLGTDTAVTVAAGASLATNNLLDLDGNTLTKSGPGTLNINNQLISGAGGTVVGNGGTISGSGTIGGSLTNNAAVAPGNFTGAMAGASVVPEPTSLLLISLGSILLLRRRVARRPRQC